MEDESGFFNLVFTPQVYERCRGIINREGFLCVAGILQSKNESHSILVKQFFLPIVAEGRIVNINSNKEDEKSAIFEKNGKNTQLYVVFF